MKLVNAEIFLLWVLPQNF